MVLLGSLPYLTGGFVWDDGPLIVDRLAQLDVAGTLRLWSVPVTGEGPGSSYYRPISMIALAVTGRWGPEVVHGLAIVVHALNVVLIIRVCRELRWPALAGLVYGLHPLMSEALGWASSLPDLLACAFGMLAVLVVKHNGLGGLVLVLAAGLSKESGLLIPLFLGVAGLAGSRWRAPVAAGIVSVVGLRASLGVHQSWEWVQKIELIPQALGWSLASLAWPVPLNAVRSIWVTPVWAIPAAGLVVWGLVYWGRSHRAALGAAGLVLGSPVIALPVMLDGYLIAERYMTPALVGLGVWAAVRIRPTFRRVGFAMVLGIVCIAVHWGRAPAWSSNAALFGASVRATPDSSYSWHLYGVGLAHSGKLSEAADAFGRGLECIRPHPLDAMLQLKALVQADRAVDAFRIAEDGPQEDLSSEYIAWWARAAFTVGDREKAKSLVELLSNGQKLDAPHWFQQWAEEEGVLGP